MLRHGRLGLTRRRPRENCSQNGMLSICNEKKVSSFFTPKMRQGHPSRLCDRATAGATFKLWPALSALLSVVSIFSLQFDTSPFHLWRCCNVDAEGTDCRLCHCTGPTIPCEGEVALATLKVCCAGEMPDRSMKLPNPFSSDIHSRRL